jgi:tetratricopeptide (TPR) repeat protein
VALLFLLAAGLAPAQTPTVPGEGGGFRGDPREQFSVGNRLYEEGRFPEAAAAYEALAAAGYASATLYFNLGNAFLKAGQLGEAIVYYERAQVLSPRAEDIRVNLAYARGLTVDVLPEEGGSAFLGGLVRFRDSVSAEEAMIAAAVALWTAAGALALMRLRPEARRMAQGILILGLMALAGSGMLAGIKVHEAVASRRAFIVIPEVAVRSGPGETFTARFTLHEGTGIEVLREAGGWTEIQLTATMNGWVPREALLAR